MIDLHTHILPCMDDGSASIAESEQMLRQLRDQGVSVVVATPHYHAQKETPREFLLRRQKAFEELPRQDGKILLGAEIAYFSGISSCEELSLLCIQGTKLFLLEMPFGSWNCAMLEEVGMIHRRLGLTPVLAHVDRYRKVPNFEGAIAQMLQCNVRLQCNAQPLLTLFGSRRWMRMLCDGEIHFIGSDCHNISYRPPNIGGAIEKMEKKLGKQRLQAFCDRARALLEL